MYKVNKKDLRKYTGTDTMMYLSRAKLGASYAAGVKKVDESTGEETPVGLAICSETNDSLIIQWMEIKGDYRYQGYGDKLLEEIVIYARECGKRKIKAYFEDSFIRKALISRDRNYFIDRGFVKEETLYGEWFADIKTIMLNDHGYEGKLDEKLDGNLVIVENIPILKFKSYIDRISENPYVSTYSNLSIKKQDYDEDISFVLEAEDGSIKGAILIEVIEGVLYPVAFLAEDKRTESIIIHEAVRLARKKYDENTPIQLILKDGRYADTAREYFGNIESTNSYLVAYIADYFNGFIQEYFMEERMDNATLRELARVEKLKNETANYISPGDGESITLRELSESESFEANKSHAIVKSIGRLDKMQLLKALVDSKYYNNADEAYDNINKLSLDIFDEELSCCITEGTTVTHMLIIVPGEAGELIPVLLYSKPGTDVKNQHALIKHAVKKALEIYPAETKVRINGIKLDF